MTAHKLTNGSERPLSGIKVVEYVRGPMRSAGRLLAELGAAVVHVLAPQCAHDPDLIEKPEVFTFFNAAKQVVELDLAKVDDLNQFRDLAAGADIILFSVGELDAELIEAMKRDYASKVLVAISPFGLFGECSKWRLSEPVFFALSGVLSQSGNAGMPPLLPPRALVYGCAAAQAVFVTLVAYWNRLRNGQGEFIDFSVFEGAALACDPGYGVAGSASAGIPAYKLPRGRPSAGFRYPIIPCKDGHVRVCLLAKRQWRNMFKWMGEPARFADAKYDNLVTRFQDPDLIPAIAELFATLTRAQIEAGGKQFGVPVAALNSLLEAIAAPHFAERNALVKVKTCAGNEATLVNGMIEVDGERMGVEDRPPVPLNPQQISGSLANTAHDGFRFPASSRPFEDVKVLDLGVIVVGAEQGRLFGDQGADVIKIENSAFPDGTRQTVFPGTVPTAFAAGNRNKRGMSINLRTERGLAIFKQLATTADVIFSNYKPGTLEALGIDFDSLKETNPGIIVVDNSAYGPSGSWAQRMGYGPLVRAVTGMTKMFRYPEERDGYGDALTVYPDHVGGRLGAIGALALMIRRVKTCKGGRVSIAQADIVLQHFGESIVTGEESPVLRDAPYGVFPAKGDDEWFVVTVQNDSEWQALCRALGRDDWAADNELRSPSGRCAQRGKIDAGVTEWLANVDPSTAMDILQKAGVAAARMLRISELPDFSAFRDRKVFREYKHPAISDSFLMENRPTAFSGIPDPDLAPAPLIAQHTAEILKERLGLSDEQIVELARAGIVEVESTEQAMDPSPIRPS